MAEGRRVNSVSAWGQVVALAILAGVAVYVGYHPSDSIAVEQGDGLWFSLMGIAIATVVAATRPSPAIALDRLDGLAIGLAGWMMLAALVTTGGFSFYGRPPIGSLRVATNEAWLWVAGAAILVAGRRLFAQVEVQRAVLAIGVIISMGLAVHGLHQQFVSLPANRAAYQQDPDAVVRMAGMDAAAGTAERMRFENRLFDGGPSATFALANSFAAVLLVGIAGAAGVIRFRFSQMPMWRRWIWGAVVLIGVAAMIAARSRSATLAMVIAIGWLWLSSSGWLSAASSRAALQRRVALKGLAAIAVVAMVGGACVAVFGNREWIEAAPASLAFRFQYWRTTLQMVADHPLWGAGPGNFQSLYERYRESTATEQISDPHNFFFETLASGGWVAAAILVAMVVVGIRLSLRKPPSVGNAAEDGTASASVQPVAVGAAVGFVLVWMIGFASRSVPDLDASLVVVPFALALAWFAWPDAMRLSRSAVHTIAVSGLLGLMVHLSVAGGWTVPGVAVWIWILAAMTTGTIGRADLGSESSWIRRWALPVGCVLLMVAMYVMSLRPVGAEKRWLATAELAQATGQIGRTRVSLEQAAAADGWAVTPRLWLADFYLWKMILSDEADGDRDETRRRWAEMLEAAKVRSGENPSVYRQIGVAQLHLYQRFGRPEDLQAAEKTFADVVRWSPANQWAMAQMAEIKRAVGDSQASREFADQAKRLSELGGNLERALYLQSIYVVRPIGREVQGGPVRARADQLLGLVP
ncbi:O-antigen ligase family protein [Rubripirellula reticaptiva]|uniref:O-Antigen ligase n=1 Tax=Rubripirellula reticaptiva TaxID=2528013 RepID=A0A5C6EM90_9BACT|nr:O-antigen ligase family protein [Rubripirellula reticaptiva]TWU49605.1 O-Antigen ligase [Rubripirellula reticaptiva]